jgi:hypothetical protein
MPWIVFARAVVQLAQRALEILNLPLVINLLALGQFQRLEHFFHLLERMFQFLDDAIDLLDGIRDGRRFVMLRRFLLLPPLNMFAAPILRAASILFGVPVFTTRLAFTVTIMFAIVFTFCVVRVLGLLDMFFGGVLRRFGRGFRWRFRAFRIRRRFAGRGQGTTVFAATRMTSAAAAGSAPSAWLGRCRITGLLGCAFL